MASLDEIGALANDVPAKLSCSLIQINSTLTWLDILNCRLVKVFLMTLSMVEAYDFLRQQNLGVISTVSEEGIPEAAFINYGVTEHLELILETLQTSRKYKNLYRNPNVAMAIVTELGKECHTCQYEGIVSWPTEAALPGLLDIYFAARPEGLLHRGWPHLVYLQIRPTWIRISNYDLLNWKVRELDLRGSAIEIDPIALISLPPPPE